MPITYKEDLSDLVGNRKVIPVIDGGLRYHIAWALNHINFIKEEVFKNKVIDFLKGIFEPIEDHLFYTQKGNKVVVLCTDGMFNFRKELPAYKANRRLRPQPRNLDIVTKILYNTKYKVVHDYLEADDIVGIVGTAYNHLFERKVIDWIPLIVSGDKDLNQIEGIHYRPKKANNDWGFYNVTSTEAEEALIIQMLMGDQVDGVKALEGVGPKRADQIVKVLDTVLPNMRVALSALNKILGGIPYEHFKPLDLIRFIYLKVYNSLEMYDETFKLIKILKYNTEVQDLGFDPVGIPMINTSKL